MTVEFFRLRPDTRSTVRAVLEYCYKVTSVDGLKGYQDGVEKSGCPWLLRNCCDDSVVFSILESFIHIRHNVAMADLFLTVTGLVRMMVLC